MLAKRGHFDHAIPLLEEQEKVCRKFNIMDGLLGSLELQGKVLELRGERDRARAKFEELKELAATLPPRRE